MAMRPRLPLVARLWFEGNRFAPGSTGPGEFQRVEWAHGDAALQAGRGTEHELATVADFDAARADWQVQVSRCAAAWPGGPIDDGLFDTFSSELLADLQRWQPDSLYLSLHGAAVAQRHDAPETWLLQRGRAALGDRPLLASFDLHANADPAWAGLLDFGSAYRTYPHVDLRATAARVLARLDSLCRGEMLHGRIVKLGALLPSFRMVLRATVLRLSSGRFVNDGPMQRGKALDSGPGALLDVHGISVIVTSALVTANDPAFFAHHGIRLSETRLLCVKAKNHFQVALAPRCAAIIEVDTPGPAMADLPQLPVAHWPAPAPAVPRA
jgi:microcystin degradation protein MlrC